jgi:hypothetical protein
MTTASALVARAEHAVLLSSTDPLRARSEAHAILTEGDPEAAAIAHRVLALSARELGDLRLAEEHLRRAVEAGRAFPVRVAQARMSLVTVRAMLGDPEGALRLAGLAERDLTGVDLARLAVQRSVALDLLGRHRESAGECSRAIPLLDDDPRFQAGALLNRGVARTYANDFAGAADDLTRCARIAEAAGLDHLALLATGNLPFVAARRGDLPAAFASYRRAERLLFGLPGQLAVVRSDFADALISAGLPGEARALLEQAAPDLAASGSVAAHAEACLKLAEVELLTGDPHRATATAAAARSALARQGRTGWLPLADDIILRARLAGEKPHAETAAAGELVACAAALAAGGWTARACALRLAAAGQAEPATAREQLSMVAAEATHPVPRHLALAMLRRLDGDIPGALATALDGLAEALPARSGPEMRAHAGRAAAELADYGLRVALETGDARIVLDWSERRRAAIQGKVRPTMEAGDVVVFVRCDERLFAVAGGELTELGPHSAAVEAAIRIRYGLRRRNLRDSGVCAGLEDELAAADRLLLAPLALPAGPVAILASGPLLTLPWPMLPSLRGRPVSVATSAITAAVPERAGHVVSVAGPGLAYAEREADAVARIHGGRRITATRTAVLGALREADVLHVAAHGTFVPRSPLLSRITLDDGELMAYELAGAGRSPRLVVLSACDAGMAHAPVDGLALGLAGTFLDLGACHVVAGIVPVRDDEAERLMAAFHALLGSGRPPDEALAAAAAKTDVDGFVCFATGPRPRPRDGWGR